MRLAHAGAWHVAAPQLHGTGTLPCSSSHDPTAVTRAALSGQCKRQSSRRAWAVQEVSVPQARRPQP